MGSHVAPILRFAMLLRVAAPDAPVSIFLVLGYKYPAMLALNDVL